MPCQVSWQSVAIKLQPSVHGLGAEAAVGADAPVGTMSAAHASTPQEVPPAARITAAKNAERCIASLPGSPCTIVGWYKVGRQDRVSARCSDARKFRSEWQPRHTISEPVGMSQTCHNRTHAPQQAYSFDHFVCACEQCGRHSKAERFSCLEIDGQIEFRGLLDLCLSQIKSGHICDAVRRGLGGKEYALPS